MKLESFSVEIPAKVTGPHSGPEDTTVHIAVLAYSASNALEAVSIALHGAVEKEAHLLRFLARERERSRLEEQLQTTARELAWMGDGPVDALHDAADAAAKAVLEAVLPHE